MYKNLLFSANHVKMHLRLILTIGGLLCAFLLPCTPAEAQVKGVHNPLQSPARTSARMGESAARPAVYTHETAKKAESTLPLQIPVSPYFYISEDLNGYVDIWRNVSYVQTEYATDSIPWIYDSLEHFVDDWTSETFYVRSENHEGLRPLKREWVVTDAGYKAMRMQYDYAQDGNQWKREEYYIIDPSPEGLTPHHLIGVIVHYPANLAEAVGPEIQQAIHYATIQRH